MAAVGSAPELLDAVERLRRAAVLTDIRMPDASARPPGAAQRWKGIDAAHAIKETAPGVGVVILSQYADESYAFELFRNGTAGLAYLLKDRVGDLQQLLAALREVTAGGSVIDPQVVERPGHQARQAPDVLAIPADAARAGRAARDGPGPRQRGHRAGALLVGVIGGETRQRHLRQARPGQRAAGAPAGGCRPDLPARRRPPPTAELAQLGLAVRATRRRGASVRRTRQAGAQHRAPAGRTRSTAAAWSGLAERW